jgi:dTMP kinase
MTRTSQVKIKRWNRAALRQGIHISGPAAKLKTRGIFITLEGIDGTGKSTQFRRLVDDLRKSGYQVCATREPGGTRVGEQIRRILLARGGPAGRGTPTPLTELTLMYAARAQHLEEVVRPALERGEVVISDRFNDASIAYQGSGRKLGPRLVKALDRLICGSTQPDLTLLLDLEPRVALKRALGREARRNSRRGRFEAEGIEFQERVRSGYLAIAQREPRRVRVVRADRPAADVAREIRRLVDALLDRSGKLKPRLSRAR